MTKRSDADLKYLQQRDYRLRRTYGITLHEYDLIKEAQDGSCYICQRARGISAPLQVDHDHELQGRESVRGLLCGRDNNRLGWYEAKRERVDHYLVDPPARGVIT